MQAVARMQRDRVRRSAGRWGDGLRVGPRIAAREEEEVAGRLGAVTEAERGKVAEPARRASTPEGREPHEESAREQEPREHPGDENRGVGVEPHGAAHRRREQNGRERKKAAEQRAETVLWL